MHIKEKFVPHQELLELFGVQRNATLIRMLDKNDIKYMLNYKKTPLVLRTSLESINPAECAEAEDTTPILSWED